MSVEDHFLEFLAALFRAKGYTVVTGGGDGYVDLSVERDGDLTIVELKVHRSQRIAETSLRNALSQLRRGMDQTGAARGILILTRPLSGRNDAELPAGVNVWDLTELIRQTRGHIALSADLVELLKALQVGAEIATPAAGHAAEVAIAELLSESDAPAEAEASDIGSAIAARLRGLEAGNADASQFEKACQDALELSRQLACRLRWASASCRSRQTGSSSSRGHSRTWPSSQPTAGTSGFRARPGSPLPL
ncbi:restriction endonuclease [Sphingomonas lenta]|uniref:restriction endonuclease n=1 Tax=Sphingomonas lenta TaxID=1141887 RepID=UPI003CCBD824